MSKAYRVHDIEARQVVISRDVNLDESAFGLSMLMSDEVAADLDIESLDLDDEDLRPTHFQQTGNARTVG